MFPERNDPNTPSLRRKLWVLLSAGLALLTAFLVFDYVAKEEVSVVWGKQAVSVEPWLFQRKGAWSSTQDQVLVSDGSCFMVYSKRFLWTKLVYAVEVEE